MQAGDDMSLSTIGALLYALIHVAIILRVLSVEDKESSARATWILVLVFLPLIGIGIYLFFGEPWISRTSRRRVGAVARRLAEEAATATASDLSAVPSRYQSAFRICERLAGGPVSGGNVAQLAADSNAAIEHMVADIDAAEETVHVSFYIWLTDHNGLQVVEALKRAAGRGVVCRAIADSIGSRTLIGSRHWKAMRDAGVHLCTSLKVLRGLKLSAGNRIDLRNHRKIVVVDNRTTWCGSQNCADPEFRVKPRFAPWVDIMLRFEGGVVRQNQLLFVVDWMVEADEDLTALLRAPVRSGASDGFPAIAFGTGPLSAKGAMSSVFAGLLYCAGHEVVISNPYFVPDPSLLDALVCCARRGVATTLILPARNDSRLVGAISKAHYGQLARAGVRLFEFRGGLLHAKTLVVDGTVALIGSANMDRRSLDLNFENNILLSSPPVADAIRARQDAWLADADAIAPEAIFARSFLRRVGDNIATIVGPVM